MPIMRAPALAGLTERGPSVGWPSFHHTTHVSRPRRLPFVFRPGNY